MPAVHRLRSYRVPGQGRFRACLPGSAAAGAQRAPVGSSAAQAGCEPFQNDAEVSFEPLVAVVLEVSGFLDQ